MFLLDSGGQYLTGTTDVTRTLHLGEPTEEQKEAYTLVLKVRRLSLIDAELDGRSFCWFKQRIGVVLFVA